MSDDRKADGRKKLYAVADEDGMPIPNAPKYDNYDEAEARKRAIDFFKGRKQKYKVVVCDE